MMEMHSFKKAEQIEIPSPGERKEATAQDLFFFLTEICEWAGSCPSVHSGGQEGRGIIYLLFRDFAFAGYDLWQIFGYYFYLVNSRWKLDVFGTAYPSQETVWLTMEEQNGCHYGVQNTISGNEIDTIHSMCLRMECESREQADMLERLFRAADWQNGIIAVDWKYHNFFTKEKIVNHWENSCFCYGSVYGDASPEDYLHALTFAQKTALWTGVLRDGFDYKEFEWLYRMILENAVENRIEWELALHTAMQGLRYTIRVSEHEFELYNSRSERKYLNFDSRQSGQMALLKILFPVNM